MSQRFLQKWKRERGEERSKINLRNKLNMLIYFVAVINWPCQVLGCADVQGCDLMSRLLSCHEPQSTPRPWRAGWQVPVCSCSSWREQQINLYWEFLSFPCPPLLSVLVLVHHHHRPPPLQSQRVKVHCHCPTEGLALNTNKFRLYKIADVV